MSGFHGVSPRGEDEGVCRDPQAERGGPGAPTAEVVLGQLAGERIDGDVPTLSVLGFLLDALARGDDVVPAEPEIEEGEVDPVLPQAEQLAAAASGGERVPAEEPELLVLGEGEVEQGGGLLGRGRVRFVVPGAGHRGRLGGVLVDPLVSLGQREGGGHDAQDLQPRGLRQGPAAVRHAPVVAHVRPGGAVVLQRAAPLVAVVRPVRVVFDPRQAGADPRAAHEVGVERVEGIGTDRARLDAAEDRADDPPDVVLVVDPGLGRKRGHLEVGVEDLVEQDVAFRGPVALGLLQQFAELDRGGRLIGAGPPEADLLPRDRVGARVDAHAVGAAPQLLYVTLRGGCHPVTVARRGPLVPRHVPHKTFCPAPRTAKAPTSSQVRAIFAAEPRYGIEP